MATTSAGTPGKNSGTPVTEVHDAPSLAPVASGARLVWRMAEVRAVITENPRTRSIVLRVPDWPGHSPGQHVDVRLTAEDGYQAQRSYSIASSPEREEVVLTVERIDDGEVSPYLTEEVRPCDRLELRGPIGGYFTWTAAFRGPLQLVAGGSGIVPLMAMLRHRAQSPTRVAARLLCSWRSRDSIIYLEELKQLATDDHELEVVHTLTRESPPGWFGLRGRIDADMLRKFAFTPEERPRVYVCGPTPFVESVADALVLVGHLPECIKTERFGPTGGQA
jgi:ferredoxin-NADP reductase